VAENVFGPIKAPELSGAPATLSIPPQDLSRDPLVANAPWVTFAGALRPAFGGIPLVAKLGQGYIPLRDQRQKACPKNSGQVLVGILS
jgi:hypothetical protein